MQSNLDITKTIAYVWPSELDVQALDFEAVALSDMEEIINQIEYGGDLIWVVYPLLGQRELEQPQRVSEWLDFYTPLVALRGRGVENLIFKAKDSIPQMEKNGMDQIDGLLIKLGCQLYPDAFEIQDQLELLASDLDRRPLFSPKLLIHDAAEIARLIQALNLFQQTTQTQDSEVPPVSELPDVLYKEKSELLMAQLRLLQTEFVRMNEELNSLREESLLTADLIIKAGSRLLNNQ